MTKTTLKPEVWNIEDIKPYENNPKKHPESHLKKLAASIKDQGLEQYPHVDRNGVLISGHGRLLAVSTILGWTKMPVYVRTDLTDQQVRRLRLASNRTASTEYDAELERIEMNLVLEEIGDEFDMEELANMTGFDVRDIELFTEDLGELRLPSGDFETMTDMSPGIEDDTVEDEEEQKIALTKTLGFKAVSPSVARKLRELMAERLDALGHDPIKASDEQRAQAFIAILEQR